MLLASGIMCVIVVVHPSYIFVLLLTYRKVGMSSVLRQSAARTATVTLRPMVGDTKTSMVRVDHVGWLVCDGRALHRAEYRGLFNVIGTEFGAPDETHFNLPDARGRVMGLIGMAAGVSPANNWVDGDVSGEEIHTLTIAELPAHNHDISGGALNTDNGVDPTGNGRSSNNATDISINGVGNHDHGGRTGETGSAPETENVMGGLGATVAGSGTHSHTISPDGAHTHTIFDPTHRHQIASNGGSQPHNNMQPTLFLGNLFIYCGMPTKNIVEADGVTPPVTRPSYYPPSVPPHRLY